MPSRSMQMVAVPNEILWALIGLILTIGGTFLEAFVMNAPWSWGQHGLHTYSLGVTCQVGAVLLVGCLGGRNAATLAQIAYILLGLAGFQVFHQGGGLDYFKEPTFGYILGFIPAAWICGSLAFQAKPRLETLTFSCLCGLLAVHLTGLVYLVATYIFNWAIASSTPILEAMLAYSIHPLPGQLGLACAASVVAYILRHLMFY